MRRLREVINYATHKGLQVMATAAPFGWSNLALAANGNLAEGQRIIGAPFVVGRDGRHLNFVNELPPLENAGFEAGHSAWFGTGDAAVGLSSEAHSGKQAAVIVDAPGNARFRQRVSLTPWRQYHLSLWFRSKNFRGPAVLEIQDWWHRRTSRFYAEIPAAGTHDWSRLDYMFDSQDTGWAYVYFGVWGKSSGMLWFDDVALAETAPVYVIRRAGAPLKLYDRDEPAFFSAAKITGDQPAHTYTEGRDFDTVSDPALSATKVVFRDVYHAPVQVKLPPGTPLRPGQKVAMDFYAAFPLPPDAQVGMCLTDPGVFHWLEANGRALKQILPGESGSLLLAYDEMRQVNSCASCRAKNMSPGELLAWNVAKTAGLFRGLFPRAPLYVWSDMFDPLHNAHDNYFYVEGDLSGSWKGLPSYVGVLNWNHSHLRESLLWFSGSNVRQPTPHRQIIAGYYDSGSGDAARTDLKTAEGIPGIDGIMYTTWRDDYSQMERFAESARAGWKEYQQAR